ncbi:MAG: 4Fe-4S dicluster domain-containing protein [Euryarchaeota archaeon]|nr:4Fe-4S dicluster domain-containing protein [Euryarchaeota archaeon]
MELFSQEQQREPTPNTVVMLIDLKKCIGCFSCETSCKLEHDLPVGPRYLRVMQVGPKKVRGRIRNLYVPMLCFHCSPAPCVQPCPTGAISKRARDGIVWIDPEKCIGCKQCIQACPFGAIHWNSNTRKAVKCDFCVHRVDYKRTYTQAEIEKIYRFTLQNGGGVRSVAYDEIGAVRRDEKGRLTDEAGEPISGRALAERGREMKELSYEGLWSACSTKCSTECMKFGYYRDLKPYIDGLREKREIKRVCSIFYALPKEDFPFPLKAQ